MPDPLKPWQVRTDGGVLHTEYKTEIEALTVVERANIDAATLGVNVRYNVARAGA